MINATEIEMHLILMNQQRNWKMKPLTRKDKLRRWFESQRKIFADEVTAELLVAVGAKLEKKGTKRYIRVDDRVWCIFGINHMRATMFLY